MRLLHFQLNLEIPLLRSFPVISWAHSGRIERHVGSGEAVAEAPSSESAACERHRATEASSSGTGPIQMRRRVPPLAATARPRLVGSGAEQCQFSIVG